MNRYEAHKADGDFYIESFDWGVFDMQAKASGECACVAATTTEDDAVLIAEAFNKRENSAQ